VAKPSPKLYSVEKTIIWFAFASVILLISLILIVAQDHTREWKNWQREFLRLKYELTQTELETAQGKVDRKKLEALQKEHAQAQKDFKAQKPKYHALEKEIEKLETQHVKANARYQELKQFQDSYKYFLEEHRIHEDPKAREYEEKLGTLTPQVESVKLEIENLNRQREAKAAERDQLKTEEKRLESEIGQLTQKIDRTEKKLAQLKPSLIKELLNAPMLDFLRPTLQIQQVVLEDLYDDYHFTKVQKVDRCTTCHLGIDQKGFEEAPQPFRTHPRLDLFVGSNSPHSLETFGCTVCHGGNGHSLSFKDAAHTPQSEAQAKAWEKQYHWQSLEKWSAKMLPLNHAEAACAKCHKGVVDVPRADKLNEGRRLVRTFGCFGCHKIEGFENLWKVGPNLGHVENKLEKDWIVRWLQNPKAFRPETKMPRIFHLENTGSPEDREKSYAAIEGIAAYLFHHSQPLGLVKPSQKGDPAVGEKLFNDVGCLGCHSVGDFGVSDHGPNLSGIGSKTTPEWLFTWLKNPKHYNEETRMPNLRLTDEEAAHLTSYLLTLRNPDFERGSLPEVKPERLDEMVLDFMRAKMRKEEAVSQLSGMAEEEKLIYLGEKIIAHQGCFGCHDIPGFEDAKPIGTALSKEGAKEIERLDFGFIPIERTRRAWFFQKLMEPRIFDRGKIKNYLEKLKMPHFDFSEAEAQALTTFLLSQVEEPIPLEMERRLDLDEQEIETGRLLVSKLNCQGCHLLDERGGDVKELLADPGLAPPTLEGEGAKVQADWLYRFLKEPTTVRPWLTFRMPTFDFHHGELTTLVKYFSHRAHQEIFFEKAEREGMAPPSPAMLATGKKLFDTFQCAKCHEPKKASVLGASFLAPDLTLSKGRLKPDWIVEWMKDPQTLEPGTMMPAFFPDGQSPSPDIWGGDAQKQMEALRDYLLEYNPPEET